MRVEGKLNCDLRQVIVKQNQSSDGQEAFLDLDAGVTKDEAEKKFGEDFASLAFSTMRVLEAQDDDETDAIAFLVDSIKPGSRVVFELHTIDIDGEEITAQPELRGIKTVDGEAGPLRVVQPGLQIGDGHRSLPLWISGNGSCHVWIINAPVSGWRPMAQQPTPMRISVMAQGWFARFILCLP